MQWSPPSIANELLGSSALFELRPAPPNSITTAVTRGGRSNNSEHGSLLRGRGAIAISRGSLVVDLRLCQREISLVGLVELYPYNFFLAYPKTNNLEYSFAFSHHSYSYPHTLLVLY